MITVVNKVWMGLINILFNYYMVTISDTTSGYQRFTYMRADVPNRSSDATILAALGF